MRWKNPCMALASHLEGVRIAGQLEEYIKGLRERRPKSKKTRERKRGLQGVMTQLEAWHENEKGKYPSVRAVIKAVKASTSASGTELDGREPFAVVSADKRQKKTTTKSAPKVVVPVVNEQVATANTVNTLQVLVGKKKVPRRTNAGERGGDYVREEGKYDCAEQ